MIERRHRSGWERTDRPAGRTTHSRSRLVAGWLLVLGLVGVWQTGGRVTAAPTLPPIPRTGPTQVLTVFPNIPKFPKFAGLPATTVSTSLPVTVVLPAATSIAVGPPITGVNGNAGYIIEMTGNPGAGGVNPSGLAIYNKDGSAVRDNFGKPLTYSLQNWFDPINRLGMSRLGVFFANTPIFDPHVIFDQYSQRWITVALAGLPGQVSQLLIGISATSDPRDQNTWQYSTAIMGIDVLAGTFGVNGPFFCDFDQIGLNQDGVYVTCNEYGVVSSDPTKPPVTVSNFTFVHSKLRVFTRAVLTQRTLPQNLDGITLSAATPPVPVQGPVEYVDYANFQDSFTGTAAFSLQPCHSYGTTAVDGTPLPEYIVSGIPSNNPSGGTFGGGTSIFTTPGHIALFSYTASAFTTQNVSENARVETLPFSDPPVVQQPVTNTFGTSTPSTLAVGDSRLLSAVYRNGFIWTAGSTATFDSAGAEISGVHWVVIDPNVGSTSAFGTIAPASDNILTTLNGDSTYLPSITSDNNNTTYLCYNRSGPLLYPSLEAAAIPMGASSNAAVVAQVDRGASPWQCQQSYGIYNGIAVDPSDASSIWLAGEIGGDSASFTRGASNCTAETEFARIHIDPLPFIANFLPGTGNTLTESAASSISGNQIVGYAYGPLTGNVIHAVGWAGIQSPPIDLTPTPSVAPGASAPVGVNIGQSHGYSVSGVSAGGDFTPAGSASGTLHAALFTAPPPGAFSVTAIPIDLNPNGFLSSEVNAVSGGQQVGYGRMIGGDFRALLWSGSKQSVFDLTPPGVARAFALGISSGIEVGATVTPAGVVHPVIWLGATKTPVDLLPSGVIAAYALATTGTINSSSQVGFGYLAGSGTANALLWTGSAASAVDLHPSGFGFSVADAAAAGFQVGYGSSGDSGNPLHALVWSGSAFSSYDLNPSLGPNFVSSFAAGVDSTGRIVGTAIDRYGRHVAVVWVPQPGVPIGP